MKDKNTFDALFEADDETISRIAAQCEPDWDENRMFERSYRKYKAKKRGTKLPPLQRSSHDPLRALVTAACLMIAVGGAGSIWYFQYGVQKPQMTIDVETAPTDRTETTSPATETTAPATQASSQTSPAAPPETIPVIWATATELHTTAAVSVTTLKPETTVTSTVRETAASTANSTTPAPAAAPSAASSAQTAVQPVPNGAPLQTQADTAQTVPATVPSTEPSTEVTTEPADTQESTKPAETQTPDATKPPEDPMTDDGTFTMQEKNGWITIRSKSEQYIDLDQLHLSLDLDGFTLTEKRSMDYTSRLYTVHDTAAGEDWDVRYFEHDGFRFTYRSDSNDVMQVTVDGHPAYLIWQKREGTQNPPVHEDLYSLFWDNGKGICLIQDVDTGGETMLKIAEAIKAATTGDL